MKDYCERPNGEVAGRDLPMRGSRTGFVSRDTAMGKSVDPSATNRMGGIKGDTGSHQWDQSMPADPQAK